MHPALLLPFQVSALPSAQLAWRADDAPAATELLQRFAWMAKQQQGTSTREFYAERYGGSGIRTHGGGVRAGITGEWLVKGLGSNPLLGEDVDFWYSHGRMPLADALAEALWSELLDLCLPFGAAPVLTVIATGECAWWRDPDGGRQEVAGGLLVRQALLRPGSFERAIHFRPASPQPDMPHDSRRVRQMISAMPDLLRRVLGGVSGLHPAQQFYEDLQTLWRRFACQSAHAAARSLMHGALSSGNIALHGAWLDLGSVDCLPAFELDPVFRRHFWREYRSMYESLRHVFFYLRKYSDIAHWPAHCHDLIWRSCEQEFQSQAQSALLTRAGFPAGWLQQHAKLPVLQELGRGLLNLAQQDLSRQRFQQASWTDDLPLHPFAGVSMRLLACASGLASANECDLPYELAAQWRAVFNYMQQSYGVPQAALRRMCVLRIGAHGWQTPMLRRRELDSQLRQICAEYQCALTEGVPPAEAARILQQNYAALRCLMLQQATPYLAHRPDAAVLLTGTGQNGLVYDPHTDQLLGPGSKMRAWEKNCVQEKDMPCWLARSRQLPQLALLLGA